MNSNEQPHPPVRMVIEFDPRTLNITVSGPIMNKPLCKAILAMAWEQIKLFNPEQKVIGVSQFPQ